MLIPRALIASLAILLFACDSSGVADIERPKATPGDTLAFEKMLGNRRMVSVWAPGQYTFYLSGQSIPGTWSLDEHGYRVLKDDICEIGGQWHFRDLGNELHLNMHRPDPGCDRALYIHGAWTPTDDIPETSKRGSW